MYWVLPLAWGMSLLALLLLAVAPTVRDAEVALRAGCGADERAVATVRRGEPVTIRFAFASESGPCYKVAVISDGKTVEGYLPAAAVAGVEEFERSRQNAPALNNVTALPQPDANAIRQAAAERGTGDPVARAAQMVHNGQPVEALELLEKTLRANRRDAGILAMAGLAAYQGDQVRKALDYWKESLEMSPSPTVERLYRQAEREAAADLSTEKLVGARFLLRFQPGEVTAEQARGVVPLLDAEFGRLSEQLGCRAEERIVVVVQSREAYLKTTGAAEWSGGRYDGRIRVALHEGGAGGAETRRALIHEMVHACLARLGSWPAWLHEGLAQKLSGEQMTPDRRAAIQKMARSGEIPSLDRLTQTWSRLSARHAATAYQTALAAADLFYQHHGAWGVRNLLQSPEQLARITEDLNRRLRE